MKNKLIKINILIVALNLFSYLSIAQTCEWRISSATYSSVDPDGAGPATGSATFKMQIHTISGTIPQVSAITTGFSYNSTDAMIPTTTGCGAPSASAPDFVLGTTFSSPTLFTYTVTPCFNYSQTVGGRPFNRIVLGEISTPSTINLPTLTTTWVDMWTVTLWTLGNTDPQGGFVIMNSSLLTGSPNPYGQYDVSDLSANSYVANSLTATTPLALGSSILPVTFSNFTATCNGKGALLNWTTSSEINNHYFEVQRSKDGNDWYTVNKVKAKGSASSETRYEQYDLLGGAAYYRIKQVDINGTFTYSTINKTSCDNKNINVVIYPVPAKDVLNVVIISDKAIKTQMEIYDGTGKLVRQVNTVITPGTNNFRVNINGLASGQYFIRSTDTDLQLNKKFTIMQ